jgi:hypothetical protein
MDSACTSAARTPAAASTALITSCCAGPLGAVRLLLRPSWFTAEPSTTATGLPPPKPAEAKAAEAADMTTA